MINCIQILFKTLIIIKIKQYYLKIDVTNALILSISTAVLESSSTKEKHLSKRNNQLVRHTVGSRRHRHSELGVQNLNHVKYIKGIVCVSI